jgi:hypothetical protein
MIRSSFFILFLFFFFFFFFSSSSSLSDLSDLADIHTVRLAARADANLGTTTVFAVGCVGDGCECCGNWSSRTHYGKYANDMRKRRVNMESRMSVGRGRMRIGKWRRLMDRRLRGRNGHVRKGSRSWSRRSPRPIIALLPSAELVIGRLRVLLSHQDQSHHPVDVLAGVADGDVRCVRLPRLAAGAGTVPALLLELSGNGLQVWPLLLH